MHVCLGGGGSADDETTVIGHFCRALGGARRVMYIPWASDDPSNPDLANWVRSTLVQHGIDQVTVAADVDDPPLSEVGEVDGVFIGGGNTYLLLARMRETDLLSAVVETVLGGVPCYGGSAGAILLGADIGTCANSDANDVGLTDLHGANLVDGAAVWPHFSESYASAVEKFALESGAEVIALAETAGACFGDHGLIALGEGAAWRWIGNRREPLPRVA